MPCELTKPIKVASIEAEFQYRIDLLRMLNADEDYIKGFIAAVNLYEDLTNKPLPDANT
jgi:hypothetical protein